MQSKSVSELVRIWNGEQEFIFSKTSFFKIFMIIECGNKNRFEFYFQTGKEGVLIYEAMGFEDLDRAYKVLRNGLDNESEIINLVYKKKK